MKNAFSLLSLALVMGLSLIGLNSCDTIEPVVEELEELDTTFDGTYFYNVAALQSSRKALVALTDAYQNQRFNDVGEENMLSLIESQRILTDNLLIGIEALGRIKCRPPKCPPPNPCNKPNAIVCDRLTLDIEAVSDFRLPETWAAGRRILLLDEQGVEVAKAVEGISSFVERAVRYQLEAPETLKAGTLVIYEDRDGVETISSLAFEVPQ
ncbi:MAG: hypothetical protein AB8H47_11915 [Bacteroidia bacterium]